MKPLSNECALLLRRLKACDLDDIIKNPKLMLEFYPIRDPDNELTIFDEVYSLLTNGLMTKAYKFRLFFFLNLLLSSTKVPGYIVAAYIKKLSRLTLDAKPRSLAIILRLVGNLFIRHPVLTILRDRVDQKAREFELDSDTCTLKQWMDNDPFDANQTQNLKGSRAMDSCIWELMPLRFHPHPRVAEAAEFLGQTTPPEMEFELDDLMR